MKIALQILYYIADLQDTRSRTCMLVYVVMLAVISNFGPYQIGLH